MNNKDNTKTKIDFMRLVQFFPDLVKYLRLRGRQIFIWSKLILEFFVIVGTNIKREVVKRMFWGRNSFYKKAFHFIILSVTFIIFFNGVAGRVAEDGGSASAGLNVAQGQIGLSDMSYQYSNVKSFTVRSGDELGFEVYEHTVEEGETLASIAENYKLDDASPISWANGLDPYSKKVEVGQKLQIPPMKGVLKEAKKNDTPEKLVKGVKGANLLDVLELNDLDAEDEILAEGKVIFIPNGSIPLPRPGSNVSAGGTPVVLDFPNAGVDIPAGTFINPLGDPSCSGYSYSRGWATYHTGVDLAKKNGCWISAAGPGTVVSARWSGSLGFAVVIKHADGLSTLYGHGNGTFAVKEGQQVQAGQKIMFMGNTGRSFGTHLHFSLAANNNSVMNCYRCRIDPRGKVPY